MVRALGDSTKRRRRAAQDALRKAMAAYRNRDAARAAELFEQVLGDDPDCVDALYLLGTLRAEGGDLAAAERLLERAGRLQPDSPYIQTNLANVFLMQGRSERAAPALQRALALKPDLVEAHINLGLLLRRFGRSEEAERHLRAACARRPDWPQIAVNLSLCLVDLDRRREAVDLLRETLARHPGFAPACEMLGLQLGHLGESEEALHHLERYLELAGPEAEAGEAGLMLARLRGGALPERYPVAPLLANYERKAANWDLDVERPGNEFLGPRHVRSWLQAHVRLPGALRIVDLGCGTGLSGPDLRPLASRLVGVDLSQHMLDRARDRQCYDELVRADLVEFLSSRPAAFDLAVASGVFILIGDLAGLLAALHEALGIDGRAVFTAYRAERADIEVRHNLHFAHHPDYLQRAAAAAGFGVESLADCVHEYEHGQPQPGLLVVLRRR